MTGDQLSGRNILITGGTAGVGLEAARAALARGATVILGTRDAEHYRAVAQELDSDRVHPFIADLLDEGAVGAALNNLKVDGLTPTDLIHSAAGGLEGLLQDMIRIALGLRRLTGGEFDEAHAQGVRELQKLAADSLERCMTVNLEAPARLFDRVAGELGDGGSLVFYTHFWGSLFPHPQVPAYYGSIAESKHEFAEWLAGRATEWAEAGINTYVVSTSVISDTRMGHLLDRYCATLMPAADREAWKRTFVTCAQVAELTVQQCFGRPPSPGFRQIFLLEPGQVTDRLGPDDPPVRFPVALAANSRRRADEGIASAR
ncbi:MAG TPA: SDR family NAD(P)-dependent oxidoreductase [Candidatus Dormibacteraeota bacterium]|nr:SDR family NAD(P)-dependent oxidoreductase [Candidatus Dormibacteraeota bacterium]